MSLKAYYTVYSVSPVPERLLLGPFFPAWSFLKCIPNPKQLGINLLIDLLIYLIGSYETYYGLGIVVGAGTTMVIKINAPLPSRRLYLPGMAEEKSSYDK